MRTFFNVLAKDIRIRFSSPLELVFYLVLPVVFTIVLSGVGMHAGGAAAHLVLVRDTVRSPESRGLIGILGRDPEIQVREVSDPTALLSDGQVALLLTFKPTPSAQKPFDVTVRLSPWHGVDEGTVKRVATVLSGGTPATTTATISAGSADDSTSAATGNAGQIVTWVLVPLLGLGANFIAERRRGTMRRMLASPAGRGAVLAGIAGAEIVAAFVQVAILVLFGTYVLRLPWMTHPLELAALSMAFCVAGGALGALLGMFCTTQRQAGSLGLAVAMVLAVLGGCWYPAASFPASLKVITHWNPAGWAMEGFLSVLSPGPSRRWL